MLISLNRYGGGIMSYGSLINDVTERFNSDFELQQVKTDQQDDISFLKL